MKIKLILLIFALVFVIAACSNSKGSDALSTEQGATIILNSLVNSGENAANVYVQRSGWCNPKFNGATADNMDIENSFYYYFTVESSNGSREDREAIVALIDGDWLVLNSPDCP